MFVEELWPVTFGLGYTKSDIGWTPLILFWSGCLRTIYTQLSGLFQCLFVCGLDPKGCSALLPLSLWNLPAPENRDVYFLRFGPRFDSHMEWFACYFRLTEQCYLSINFLASTRLFLKKQSCRNNFKHLVSSALSRDLREFHKNSQGVVIKSADIFILFFFTQSKSDLSASYSPDWNISKTVRWIVFKICTDI